MFQVSFVSVVLCLVHCVLRPIVVYHVNCDDDSKVL